MKKYIVEINLQKLIVCDASLVVIALVISYFFYENIGFLYIVMAIVPVVLVQLLFKQSVYIDNEDFILEESSIFGDKKFTFSIDDISDMKSYIVGFSIRVRERTILLDYCKYKKSDIDKLIRYIKMNKQ